MVLTIELEECTAVQHSKEAVEFPRGLSLSLIFSIVRSFTVWKRASSIWYQREAASLT